MATQLPELRTDGLMGRPPPRGSVLQGQIGEYGVVFEESPKPRWYDARNDKDALKIAAQLIGIPYPFTLKQFRARRAVEIRRREPYRKIYPIETQHPVRAGIAVLAAGARRLISRMRRL